MPFLLEFLTPEKVFVSAAVESVIAPGIEGYFGVLPKHTYFVTPLAAGTVKVKQNGRVDRYEITGGICEVTPDKVVILASSATALKTGSA
jgi:F-type H+-transporting ATPase subunit epsilon